MTTLDQQFRHVSNDDRVDAVGRPSKLDAWARDMIRRKLTRLDGATLSVRDPIGDWAIGDGPEISVQVHATSFYRKVLLGGALGAAESYIEGEWDTTDLTGLLRAFARDEQLNDALEGGPAKAAAWLNTAWHRLRKNTHAGSRRNIHSHYDLGNDFFSLFLDPTMTYSAGIFDTDDSTLEQASIRKLDHICQKLRLCPSDHVLEIGTGWGSFSLHAATHYGCKVTTTTISEEQYKLAAERIAAAGLSGQIELLQTDYRDLTGQYDKLVSIEMIEAVGHDFLPGFFGKCASLLKDDGAMALQAITISDQRYDEYRKRADFIQRYIFPGSCIPSISAMLSAARTSTDLRLSHLEDIGPHYARTLALWREQFFENSSAVLELGYPPALLRLWDYYLCYCEAGFEERYLGDVQLVFEKPKNRAAPIVQPFKAP